MLFCLVTDVIDHLTDIFNNVDAFFFKHKNICCSLIVIPFCVGDMIRLFKVKEKQRELAENSQGGVPVKKQTAGELRLHKGFNLPYSEVILVV